MVLTVTWIGLQTVFWIAYVGFGLQLLVFIPGLWSLAILVVVLKEVYGIKRMQAICISFAAFGLSFLALLFFLLWMIHGIRI